MINNLEIIERLLVFETQDDFYHLQIIKRKKEHPELGSNSYVVKTYYISSIEYLQTKFGEIQSLCDYHNARAYINPNRRSFKRIALHALKKLTDQILNEDYKSVRKVYESVCGEYSNEPVKKWIVDIDTKDETLIRVINNTIKNCEPNRRQDKVLAVIETKNGYHLITSAFNREEFKKLHPEIEIHTNNPTCLYLP